MESVFVLLEERRAKRDIFSGVVWKLKEMWTTRRSIANVISETRRGKGGDRSGRCTSCSSGHCIVPQAFGILPPISPSLSLQIAKIGFLPKGRKSEQRRQRRRRRRQWQWRRQRRGERRVLQLQPRRRRRRRRRRRGKNTNSKTEFEAA